MQHNLKKQLKHATLKVFDGMSVRWSRNSAPQALNVENILKHVESDPAYAVSDSLVAVVFGGELYVGPQTHELMAAIEDSGIPQGDFRVPFSGQELPQGPALEKWQALIEQAVAEERAMKKAQAFKAHKKQPAFKPAPATA